MSATHFGVHQRYFWSKNFARSLDHMLVRVAVAVATESLNETYTWSQNEQRVQFEPHNADENIEYFILKH